MIREKIDSRELGMNIAFASSNEFGIPDLNLDMMARQIDLPTHAWRGKRAKLAANTSTWHFYTAERNFSALKKDPSTVAETPAYSCVEPNFGIAEDSPRCIALTQIYWKRYCARFWQTEGKHIFVDLHVPENFLNDNLIGVPPGWMAYATRGSYGDGYVRMTADEINRRLDLDLETARSHAGKKHIQMIVYAGGRPAELWCRENGAFFSPNYRGEKSMG